MKYLISLLIITNSYSIFSQKIDTISNENSMLDYYNIGTDALKNGDYTLADSLFSRGLVYQKRPDVYYNAGITKLMLGDTLSFCYLMKILSNSGDEDAAKLYFEFCASVDSVYLNKDLEPVSEKNKRYTIITEKAYYEEYRFVIVMDEKRSTSKRNYFKLLETEKSNIIATYKDLDSLKLFTFCLTEPKRISNEAHYQYRVNNRFKSQLIQELGLQHKLSVNLLLTIGPDGIVRNWELKDYFNHSISEIEIDEKVLNKYLHKIANEWPPYHPAKHLKQLVSFQVSEYLTFE